MLSQLQGIFRRDAPPPSLDAILAMMDSHITGELVTSAPESKPRTPFDSDIPRAEMGFANLSLKQQFQLAPQIAPLFIHMQRGARLYDDNFKPTKTHATPQFLHKLQDMARSAGARDIAYIKVPNNAIFKDMGIPYRYAIVFTVTMDKSQMDTAPSFACQLEVIKGYKRMAQISMKLSKHMRKNGFAAYPGMALGGSTDYPQLAELAGLGAIGYHGLLISPIDGALLRINTIYTNIENLPLADPAQNEHLWVRDFCAKCRKCVRDCPVGAIYDEPNPRGDGGMQCIDHATCRDYFNRQYGCAVCMSVCPFTQVSYDKVKERFKGNPDAPHFQIEPIYLDDIPVK